jgi:hypothetical protein
VPEDNVAPMLDDLPDPEGRDAEDPDAPGTEREADLQEREAGANEEKQQEAAELAPGDAEQAERDRRRRPTPDEEGVNDPVDESGSDRS